MTDITYESIPIERIQNLKYLVNIDRTLAFSEHVEKTVKIVWQGLSALKYVAYLQLLQRTLFILIKRIVLSKKDYEPWIVNSIKHTSCQTGPGRKWGDKIRPEMHWNAPAAAVRNILDLTDVRTD